MVRPHTEGVHATVRIRRCRTYFPQGGKSNIAAIEHLRNVVRGLFQSPSCRVEYFRFLGAGFVLRFLKK
jgi:hypothetical protein